MKAEMNNIGYFDNDGNLKSEGMLNEIYPTIFGGEIGTAIHGINNYNGEDFLDFSSNSFSEINTSLLSQGKTNTLNGCWSILEPSYNLGNSNLSIMSATTSSSAIRRIARADVDGFAEGYGVADDKEYSIAACVIWATTYAVVRSAEQTKRELK